MPNEADRAAHRRALSLFEKFAGRSDARRDFGADEPPEVLAILSRLEAVDGRARASFPTSDDAENVRRMLPLPKRVGSYRLAELIGEGGMGLVFAGVRDDGLFDHRVAIKLIHPERFGPAAVSRFNRERRLLARLDHPFIARLIDGGVTDDGWPYIIMELIAGTTIDRHVADARYSTDAIIELLVGTAEALKAAHDSLVIHGDIKPDNILVRADGTPRLLDFGVARWADIEPPSELTGRTAAFCAPEIRLGASSTARSDIYSFGALMRDLLGEREGVMPDHVRRIPDRSLEAIAAKAMATDPEDRYDYVGGLLSDLRRWRERRPVSARRRNVRYVVGLFARRHWLSSAIVTALLLTLGIVFVSTIVAWRSARARVEDVRTLTHYQLVDLDRRLGSLPHSIALRTQLATEAQGYLSRLALDSGSPDELRREAADGFRRLALLQGAADRPSLGDAIAARVSFAKAVAMLQRDTIENRAMSASILIDAARVASGDAQPALAARLLDRARPHVTGDEDRARYLLVLSEVEQWNGQYARAIAAARDASRSLAILPSSPDTMAMRISAVDLAAEASFYAGDRDQARVLYRRALDLATRATQQWPDHQKLKWMMERANWALGTTLLDGGDAVAATPLLERAYLSSRKTAFADPGDGVAQRRFRSFMLAYGQGLIGSRTASGIALIAQSQRLREDWWRRSPRDEARQRDWIIATLALGDAFTKTGDLKAACRAYGQARSVVESLRAERRLTALDTGRLTKTFQDGDAFKACRGALPVRE